MREDKEESKASSRLRKVRQDRKIPGPDFTAVLLLPLDADTVPQICKNCTTALGRHSRAGTNLDTDM
jgi:hypothetical protein